MLAHRFNRLFSYHIMERLPQTVAGALKGHRIKAYWYREKVNFGDLLTPIILRHHGFTPIHSYPQSAQLASTGSILEHLPHDFGGFVLGSGFISSDSRCSFPNAKFLAVRGRLTRERIDSISNEIPLGDPGLYAAKIMSARRDATYALGIIPHHSNLGSPVISKISARARNVVRIISPMATPIEVLAHIQRCEMILSSSLHGLIMADALGIPSIWYSEKNLLGGTFKFLDYASAVLRQNWKPVELAGDETLSELSAIASCAPRDSVAECQEVMARAFDRFTREMNDRR